MIRLSPHQKGPVTARIRASGAVSSSEMSTQQSLPFGDRLQNLVRDHTDMFRPGFATWLAGNRHVWLAFEREANRVWNRGRRHYSARTLIEYLRHETALADDGREWRLNNNAAPDLARLYRLTHPDRAGLFELRVMPGSERAA